VELLFPRTLSEDMRDVIYTPYRSRFAGVLNKVLRKLRFLTR